MEIRLVPLSSSLLIRVARSALMSRVPRGSLEVFAGASLQFSESWQLQLELAASSWRSGGLGYRVQQWRHRLHRCARSVKSRIETYEVKGGIQFICGGYAQFAYSSILYVGIVGTMYRQQRVQFTVIIENNSSTPKSVVLVCIKWQSSEEKRD